MEKIIKIEGIGEHYASRLSECGIDYQEQLLEQCALMKDRKLLAKRLDISYKRLLKWTNQADLARVKGVGKEYAELLERAGVDTVPELAHRNAHNLHEKLRAANEEFHLVRHLPSDNQVEEWVERAKLLPRVINY